jgi:voltage-gated potassium channel
MVAFVTILVRFIRAVGSSWKDPEFRGLFFSVVTLTTVGYGDLVPSTAAGKVFTILYILVGIGIILGFVNAVAERSMERREERARSRR